MTKQLCLVLLALTTKAATADSPAAPSALYERATALMTKGDAAQAAGLLEQAAAIDSSLGAEGKERLARDWAALGLCLSALGRTDEAVARLEAVVALWRTRDAPAETVVGLEQLAVVEFSHGRLDAAQAHFDEALILARADGLSAFVPGLRSNLGMVLQAKGQDAPALEQYQQALTLSESASDTAKTLGNIANLHLTAGHLAEAEAAYLRARSAFEAAGDLAGGTTTAVNLGMVYMTEGKYDEAREALAAGLERARGEGLTAVQASALLHLAHVYEATGLFDKAESAYEESLALFRAADDPQRTAAATSGLGSLYLAWGRTDRALVLAEQALALAERYRIQDQILGSLELLGNAERIGGHFNTAILRYQRALDLALRLDRDGDKTRIESALGTAFFCWLKPTEAERHFREALKVAERLGLGHAIAQAWIHLGAVRHLEGDAQGARESYRRGLELSRAAGTKPDEATALSNLGTLALNLGDRREAERDFLESIALEEGFRSASKDDDRSSSLVPWLASYRWLIQLHFLDGDASAVFDASERIKARRLAERISARGERPAPEPVGIDTFRRELAPSVAIVSFANVDWRYPVAVVATRTTIQAYALAAVDPKGPSARQTEAEVPDVLQPGVMPRDSALGKLLADYRDLLALSAPSAAQRGRRDALARRLFTILLGPAESVLARADEIVIIPEGSLSLIPFETLRLPDGHYLVERHHVTYAPSLRVMQLLRQRRHATHARSLLAMGGAPYGTPGAGRTEMASARRDASAPPEVSPRQWQALRAAARRRLETGKGAAEVYAALGRGSWADLPGARTEVETIGRLIPGSMVLSGEEVSEAKLKALSRAGILRQFQMLHFATHGITIAEAPELSALVFSEAGRAGGQAEDGYLSVEEIAGLDLQPDFVNLSACESGLGRIYGGEGAVGLTQAFLEAGANGVSVSLWQVHDTFTRDFMIGLYRRVREQRQSPARAMTAIKRSLIRQGKTSPSLWAPFVYYGND